MSNNHMAVKSKFKINLNGLYSKTSLFISLLLTIALVSSSCISMANGATVVPNIVVGSEMELLSAVGAAPDNTVYVIGLGEDIVLENTLEIPQGKNITLMSVDGFRTLSGTKFQTTIRVAGLLTIDGIGVTHMVTFDDNANGVHVRSGGTFILVDGKIFNNSLDGRGAGVNNLGTFIILGGEISDNSAFAGSGVYNLGVFEMSGGKISNNMGEGVYNLGSFTMSGGEITNNYCGVYNDGGVFEWFGGVIENNTLRDGTVNNVSYAEDGLQDDGLFSDDWWLYFLLSVLVIGAVAGVLLVYRSKKSSPL